MFSLTAIQNITYDFEMNITGMINELLLDIREYYPKGFAMKKCRWALVGCTLLYNYTR